MVTYKFICQLDPTYCDDEKDDELKKYLPNDIVKYVMHDYYANDTKQYWFNKFNKVITQLNNIWNDLFIKYKDFLHYPAYQYLSRLMCHSQFMYIKARNNRKYWKKINKKRPCKDNCNNPTHEYCQDKNYKKYPYDRYNEDKMEKKRKLIRYRVGFNYGYTSIYFSILYTGRATYIQSINGY